MYSTININLGNIVICMSRHPQLLVQTFDPMGKDIRCWLRFPGVINPNSNELIKFNFHKHVILKFEFFKFTFV